MKPPRHPNLFIIGAMKSGTTSLHNYLGAHPDIFMCEPKEPGYFVEELALSRGLDWYLGLFSSAKDEAIVGESSTHYAKLPLYRGVPERIAQFNANARIVYVVRDPIDRAISHYWHNVRSLRWEAERRDMLTAIKRDPQYRAFSDYACQLEPYMRLFGRDRVYVLPFESLAAEPRATMRGVLAWLGVDQTQLPATVGQRWNTAPREAKRARGLGILNKLRHSALWAEMSPWVPPGLRAFGSALAQRRVSIANERTDDVVAYLRPYMQERTLALSAMLGREFPQWTTLWASADTVAGAGGGAPGSPPDRTVRAP